jgi:hypothetical protein
MKNHKLATSDPRKKASSTEYKSYEEYVKDLLPDTNEDVMSEVEDPDEFGSELAQVSLRKLEQRLAHR